jgi:proliferating cell nuclear antigen PCNA
MELLQNNIKIGCFDITATGIHLRMMDSNRRLLIDVALESKKFYHYCYEPPSGQDVIHVGVNLNHLFKLLKCIKKKDSIHLFITERDPTNLGIQIISKDKCPPITTASFIKIQNIQNLEIHLPGPYHESILISTVGFSKMCKDMITISNTVVVHVYNRYMKFFSNIGNIYSREVILGDTDDLTEGEDPVYMEEFDTEIFSRIAKICGLGQNMHVLYQQDLPLLIKSNVGNLGTIHIFIKNKSQIAHSGTDT